MTTGVKNRIFRAAQKLFVEKGYHSTSMPEIVREAGVSTGAIYHHYAGKEELAKEIHNTAVTQFLVNYDNEVRPEKTTYGKIRAYTSMMFRWTEGDPVMVKYMLHARPKEVLNRNLSVCSEEGLQGTSEIVNHGIRTGDIKPLNPLLAAALISGPLMRLIELRLDAIIENSLVEFTEAAVNNIWLSLRT